MVINELFLSLASKQDESKDFGFVHEDDGTEDRVIVFQRKKGRQSPSGALK